ncbi:MAG: ribonuclease J, partial [Rhizobiaceae bacterium]
MTKFELLFVPLGGVGEIGMNLALYGYGPEKDRAWIMVDCGVTFPNASLPGVDLVLPDIRFAESLGDALKAIVITHAHEDHYGAILSLWPRLQVPVWMTPFTAGLLEAKANSDPGNPKIPVNIFRAGDSFNISPFEIEAIYVTHSIPEPVSLAINTPAGRVIHTGDWKLDSEPALGKDTDSSAFKRLGDEGVLALICDSTNAMREGVSPTEQSVSDNLEKLIANAPGRVAITTFSSNIGRIRSIALAAERAGRKVMLMGRSIRRMSDVAGDLGYLDGLGEFVEEDDFSSIDRNKVVIILTGSQGESRAALAKLARDEHPRVHLSPGDRVIYSSRTIPGNEKEIIDTKNLLIEQGVEIITDDSELVHVSGHPRRNELEQMYTWTRPQILVPVHGEAMHLSAHAKFAAENGIPQVLPIRNGDLVKLAPGAAEIIDQVPCGRIFKDGNLVGDADAIGVSDRRKISYAGLVAVSIVLEKGGQLADEIDIELVDLPKTNLNKEPFDDILFDAAAGAIESIPPKRRKA